MMIQEQLERICRKAEALQGGELGEQRLLLAEMAAQRACAACRREDIPPEMEQAVAALLLELTAGNSSVKSIQRGDTAITYRVGGGAEALLAPFRRLGSLEADA